MTIEEFSRNIVPLVQALIGVLGLGSLLLLWWQMRQTTLWNKLQAEQTFAQASSLEHAKKMVSEGKRVGVDLQHRVEPLTDEEAGKIWEDTDAAFAFKALANDFEATCAAIRLGIVDSDVAYSLHNHRVVNFWKIYAPLVVRFRTHYKVDDLSIETERVAEAWAGQRATLEARYSRQAEAQIKTLREGKGVARKV